MAGFTIVKFEIKVTVHYQGLSLHDCTHFTIDNLVKRQFTCFKHMKSLFPKGPTFTFHSSEKTATFKITILHFINSDDFVVNEICHM